jgi:hypothetical protein
MKISEAVSPWPPSLVGFILPNDVIPTFEDVIISGAKIIGNQIQLSLTHKSGSSFPVDLSCSDASLRTKVANIFSAAIGRNLWEFGDPEF